MRTAELARVGVAIRRDEGHDSATVAVERIGSNAQTRELVLAFGKLFEPRFDACSSEHGCNLLDGRRPHGVVIPAR